MKPLADYADTCRKLASEDFAREHPHPFLVSSSSPNKGTKAGTGLTVVGQRHPASGLRDSFRVIEVVGKNPRVAFVRVGRAEPCDVIIDDDSVSRVHASFQRAPEGWRLIDAHASSGTSVNDQSVASGASVALATGDRIRLGSLEVTFLDPPGFHRLVRGFFP